MLQIVFVAVHDGLQVKSDLVVVQCGLVRGLKAERRVLSARFMAPTLVKHALDASYAAAAPAGTPVL